MNLDEGLSGYRVTSFNLSHNHLISNIADQYPRNRRLDKKNEEQAKIMVEGGAPIAAVAAVMSKNVGHAVIPKQISNLKQVRLIV